MPRTKKPHAPRSGRPRAHEGDYKIVMLRWPAEDVDQLHALAAAEVRSINAVMHRLYRAGLKAEGHACESSEQPLATAYSSS